MDFAPVAAVAERQHGLVTGAQLRASGIGVRTVKRWVAEGRLVREQLGVVRLAGCPVTPESRVLAAILVHGPGTYASHRTAAWLWGLDGFGPPGRVELVRSTDRSNKRAGALVHRSGTLLVDHLATLRSIPVVSLPRTVFDLAGTTGARQLERVVESALRTRHCTVGSLHLVLASCGGRGRRGTVALRTALVPRGAGYVPTESELDALGRAVVASVAGLEWQVELSDERGYIRRVDGLHRAAGLVIEWDGAEHHDRPQQRALDAEGDARLRRLGLDVVRYRWGDVTGTPDRVLAEVAGRVARATRAAERAPAVARN